MPISQGCTCGRRQLISTPIPHFLLSPPPSLLARLFMVFGLLIPIIHPLRARLLLELMTSLCSGLLYTNISSSCLLVVSTCSCTQFTPVSSYIYWLDLLMLSSVVCLPNSWGGLLIYYPSLRVLTCSHLSTKQPSFPSIHFNRGNNGKWFLSSISPHK